MKFIDGEWNEFYGAYLYVGKTRSVLSSRARVSEDDFSLGNPYFGAPLDGGFDKDCCAYRYFGRDGYSITHDKPDLSKSYVDKAVDRNIKLDLPKYM